MVTDDAQGNRGREEIILFPLHRSHPRTNIQTLICGFETRWLPHLLNTRWDLFIFLANFMIRSYLFLIETVDSNSHRLTKLASAIKIDHDLRSSLMQYGTIPFQRLNVCCDKLDWSFFSLNIIDLFSIYQKNMLSWFLVWVETDLIIFGNL